MKQRYLIGGNAISISVPDDLKGWKDIESRYAPFAADSEAEPVLDVEIRVADKLPESETEMIYDTGDSVLGIITGRASVTADGCLVVVFKHCKQDGPRLWMKMSPGRDRVEMVILAEEDRNDPLFLTHALMIAFMLATTGNGTLVIHSSTVLYDGKAYLFQGKSGTGKSTHASLWLANIAGTELLNDDNPIIRFADDGTAMVYGSPWSGKTDCYRNISAPIGGMVRIVRSQTNELKRLPVLRAYASLASSVAYLPLLSEVDRDVRHQTIERLVGAVPCCEMHCRPDADAALTCMTALTKM